MADDGTSTTLTAQRSARLVAALGAATAILVIDVLLHVRPDVGLMFLLAVPVALIAHDHGPRAAALAILVAAAALAATTVGQAHELSVVGYSTRAAAYLLAGAGAVWLGRVPAVEGRAHEHEHEPEPAAAAPAPAVPNPLTARELDVLRLIASGHTNKEAALALGISVRTVESHRAHMQQKLACWGRSDLFRRAQELGLIAS